MSALTMTGVRKAFTDTVAVDDVSLHVPHGSLTAVLGPSGCGKTTLLRLIAGFPGPRRGHDRLRRPDRRGPGADRCSRRSARLVMSPGEGALFPHLDVAGNIGFGLPRALRRSPGAEGDRIDEMLDPVELPRVFRTRQPHELSGGQQQRVALARAPAPGPSVVLLDEPFSSLDASLRESTGRAVARALRAARATGLLVTHDQSEALSLADQSPCSATGA
ncbi:ABC transporter ATP-binding protein [Nocardioides sp. B-3]|uniref:ABC transporter ATP-binding protein n=1 Tax=Nocardioides sp. B-3 TaxID=2895565 RepID=UPI002152A983|nr:ATP-binding cassette domain-containing protein [Nocardioides sp. B-3]UUZ58061.1 ATP-binding cassette domain-containing protein [Nocardioides sp. B-3]